MTRLLRFADDLSHTVRTAGRRGQPMTQRDLGLFLVIAGVILLAGQLAGHLNDIDAILAGLDL